MKNILFSLVSFFIMAFIMPVLSSCSKDDDSEIIPEEKSNYYVKYEIVCYHWERGSRLTITYNDDKGKQSIELKNGSAGTLWDATYGPVKKDFEAYLEYNLSASRGDLCGRIYVSKDKEPFVIKAEERALSGKLNYKFDF